ncbi:hypothetical protein E4T56_gene5565 [Termitomyces sp. T112]|nr:hypothetical protein E4T56_gene5565 [Termitomyces sp. T112]
MLTPGNSNASPANPNGPLVHSDTFSTAVNTSPDCSKPQEPSPTIPDSVDDLHSQLIPLEYHYGLPPDHNQNLLTPYGSTKPHCHPAVPQSSPVTLFLLNLNLITLAPLSPAPPAPPTPPLPALPLTRIDHNT